MNRCCAETSGSAIRTGSLALSKTKAARRGNVSMNLVKHQHGKARVRIGRTWKEGDKHYFVEWNVQALLKSDMEHAFLSDSNKNMTATDTVKNNVRATCSQSLCLTEASSTIRHATVRSASWHSQCYFIAKQMSLKSTIEEFATTLAEHFCSRYPLVSAYDCDASCWMWHAFTRRSGSLTALLHCFTGSRV